MGSTSLLPTNLTPNVGIKLDIPEVANGDGGSIDLTTGDSTPDTGEGQSSIEWSGNPQQDMQAAMGNLQGYFQQYQHLPSVDVVIANLPPSLFAQDSATFIPFMNNLYQYMGRFGKAGFIRAEQIYRAIRQQQTQQFMSQYDSVADDPEYSPFVQSLQSVADRIQQSLALFTGQYDPMTGGQPISMGIIQQLIPKTVTEEHTIPGSNEKYVVTRHPEPIPFVNIFM